MSRTVRLHLTWWRRALTSRPAMGDKSATLRTRLFVAEESMKRQWRIHRELVESSGGQHRWDRACQCLLRWASHPVPKQSVEALTGSQPTQEVSCESGSVRTSVAPTSSSTRRLSKDWSDCAPRSRRRDGSDWTRTFFATM